MNALRQILVAGTAVAAVIAATYGRWLTVAVLSAAVLVHGYLSWRLARDARELAAEGGTPARQTGIPPAEQL